MKGLLILLLLLPGLSVAQIQWANKVYHQFNNYNNTEYSGEQALGAPDVMTLGQLNPKAFRMIKEKSFGSLVVEFTNAQQLQQIIIIQNNHPGNIVNVDIYDETGRDFKVYKAHSHNLPYNNEALVITLPETSYKIKRIEIDLNSNFNEGWSQIDAVGIANANKISEVKSELWSYADYHITEVEGLTGERESLGDMINTEYDEVNPVISQDGKILYFSRSNYHANVGGNKDYGDIYVSEQIGNQWSIPKNIGAPLNDESPNGVSSVFTDGNTLLLINSYDETEEYESDLSLSHKEGNEWTLPKGVIINDLENVSDFVDYFIGSSGKVMIMAIEDEESYGDQDLYVSFSEVDNQWSKPVNLGSMVNTSQAEFAPFLASDGKTLYFSSYGHRSFGKSDIFYTRRLDETWTNWSKPKNLGEQVNSSGFDGYYTITADGHYAYFVSDTGGKKGSRDIFRITLEKEFKPEPVIFIYGNVYNKLSNEPIGARIVFEILPDGKEEGVARSNPQTGEYKIILPRGHNYGYFAEAEGFLSQHENIDLKSTEDYIEIHKDLFLVPFSKDQSFVMKNIFFLTGKSFLLDESFPELNRLVSILAENHKIKVEISGHTDNTGTDETNNLLSFERANAVKGYLTTKGISDSRIYAKGYGSQQPIAANDTEEGRKLNRRVEVKILDH